MIAQMCTIIVTLIVVLLLQYVNNCLFEEEISNHAVIGCSKQTHF